MAGVIRDRKLRKILLLFSILMVLLGTVPSMAQDQSEDREENKAEEEEDSRKKAKHYLGAKAGQNFSWLNLEPSVPQNIVHGPVLGISYNYMSQHFAGLIIEAQIIKYGWEEVFLDSMNTYSRELTYLEVPVLTNFVIGKKKTHLKFQAGVRFAMILDDVENSDVAEELTQYYNGLEIEDKFELGIAAGGSLSRIFSIGEIQIDGRFNMTFSNLFKPASDLSLLYSQNQAMTFSIYYWFKVR